MKKRVAVGISGGVDSSVAAWLLKQQGYDVLGIFMINWHDTTGTLAGDCPWNDDLVFAELVARKVGIPLKTVDFSDEYRKRVVDYMFAEYQHGRTPNPDVLCNREVKFDLFVKAALEYEADFMATGHYCRKDEWHEHGKTIHRLMQGLDCQKDQSYFLCQLSQEQLSRAMFPIGNLIKQQVREIARSQQLPTAERKDSQGICFVGKVHLPDFLKQKLQPLEGRIIEINRDFPAYREYAHKHRRFLSAQIDLHELTKPFNYGPGDGTSVGKHQGAHYFTIGQRKGLFIGGKAEPVFVIATNTTENILYVGMGHDHPGLNRWGLFIPENDIHWLRTDKAMHTGDSRNMMVRIRYRQPLQMATLTKLNDGMHIIFEKRQRGITPGQFAAWYEGDELIGSGVIQ